MANKHFMIVNVQNDEKVITAIIERQNTLVEKGFSKIIGLRDMYSERYCIKYNGLVSIDGIKNIQDTTNEIIRKQPFKDNIKIFYSIMEFEAWFLSMPEIFIKLSNNLTKERISEVLNMNIFDESLEYKILKPANVIGKIFNILGEDYKKSEEQIERIVSVIDEEDIKHAMSKSISFNNFYKEL